MINRCTRCVIPDTRPDTPFTNGVCAACLAFERRPQIDWNERENELRALLARHDNRCIVPSSGGKDSSYQVKTLLELGADVTIVTATTCMLTPIGRANIDNLARYARTIEVTPNREVRAKLNRAGLQMVGDISWPEHVSIFTTPFAMASKLRVPLIFYGENPQDQYGGPAGTEEARTMTRRWVSEFGGLLGLRPEDVVGFDGIRVEDMVDYVPPQPELIEHIGVEAHFLGQYIEWDSERNGEVAAEMGMQYKLPCLSNYWERENQDNAMTGLHDFFGYLKYGYGRGAAQISVDVRYGRVTRDEALAWVREHDGHFPKQYMDVHYGRILNRIGLNDDDLKALAANYTNFDIFEDTGDPYSPMLRE